MPKTQLIRFSNTE